MGGANKYFCWMHAFPCPRHKNWLNHVKNSCLVSSRWTFSSFSLTFLSFFFFLIVPIKIPFSIKITVGKVKKRNDSENGKPLSSWISFLFILSARSIMLIFFGNLSNWLLLRACISLFELCYYWNYSDKFSSMELLLKQIHTSVSFFQPEKDGSV